MPKLPPRSEKVYVDEVAHSQRLRSFDTNHEVRPCDIEGLILTDVRTVGPTIVFTLEEPRHLSRAHGIVAHLAVQQLDPKWRN